MFLEVFDGFVDKASAVGFIFKQSFEKKNSVAGVFFMDLQDFWKHLSCRARTTVSVLFWDTIIINM